ncbi:hypothetical protein F441_04137 [Phytophthora nicotianae CJ01A1]|uniref:Uncharacterized protein n=2 Tax=Phytophthora nicotianae TaxID=4792 RepID=W2HQS3_PHYNI|nr:hypothetical protein L915_21841 [Phytophthora nicotianae]ETL24186.1 hypothetical protein L916_21802 [Phytophthora nicotianae]ETP22599.1 hypothetical protein F441_04137 [Phytophthora nicotianae CJ01A1]
MTGGGNHSNAVKIEVLLHCEEKGWDASERPRQLGIQRTTLHGWMENKDDIFSSTFDPSAKRTKRSGAAPPTLPYDTTIVKCVKQKVGNVQESYRRDIIAEAILTIPGFSERGSAAQGSRATRFTISAPLYPAS